VVANPGQLVLEQNRHSGQKHSSQYICTILIYCDFLRFAVTIGTTLVTLENMNERFTSSSEDWELNVHLKNGNNLGPCFILVYRHSVKSWKRHSKWVSSPTAREKFDRLETLMHVSNSVGD
jgi:hypothetical protein